MEAIIFNIQRFCLHDGPGIRTAVFFKGCPLRCGWCANPESQRAEPEPMRSGEKSELSGEAYSLERVLSACLRDREFYEGSGGGVTLTGGEPLTQSEFAAALLDALRGEGVHTAVETSGCANAKTFERVATKADLLLFDVKHWRESRHIEGTGASLVPIWQNLRRAASMAASVLPRIPVIPGYNDAPEDARAFAEALTAANLRRAQLLPFHQFGEQKYAQLAREYPYKAAKPLREQDLYPYRDAMRERGVEAFF